MQPLTTGASGVLRFKENAIVRDLLDFAAPRGFGMNEMASRDYTQGDREQFAQLIGYSLSGYGELSYVSDQTYSTACNLAEGDVDSEQEGRLKYQDEMLAQLREQLRKPIAALYGIHVDDLRGLA
jgi:hypothetical protein